MKKSSSTFQKTMLGLLFVMLSAVSTAQTVSVQQAPGNPMGFVNELMDNACLQVSNARISSDRSIAYFKDNGGGFPISEGVLIRSGEAELTEGKYTGEGLSSQVNSNGDTALEQLNARSGQSPLVTDVAFLEFEFVPLSSNFNFNFLFASNEYGEWQCVSSDVFAFLLTDLTTGETKNLAVIPGSDVPVSVRNIKDNAYNGSCQDDNANLFSSYQVDDPNNSVINMRGYTKVMNASSDIKPGRPYRIRLVIGDTNDEKYDSAIFLEAGSFSADVDLGPDLNLCQGDSYLIGTDLDTSLYTHTWTYNGAVIPNETSNSLRVDNVGTYAVQVTKTGTSCLITDEVVVAPLAVKAPVNLTVCNDGSSAFTYNLLKNNEAALGLDDTKYDLKYFSSQENLLENRPIAANQLSGYTSAGNQTIYVKLVNNLSKNTCEAVYSFDLLVNDPVVAHIPAPIESCLSPNSSVKIDLTQAQQEILGSQDPQEFSVLYFTSKQDAEKNRAAISNPKAYSIAAGVASKTLWARVQDKNMTQCYAVTNLQVRLNNPPPVDNLNDVFVCVEYILPPLTHGNYFTSTRGRGTAMFPGDVITETKFIHIFNGPDENGCTNETSFKVNIIEEYGVREQYCGKFTVPRPPKGRWFTQPGGPNGQGVELNSGTVLTTDQTIYHYVELDGVFCRDKAFKIDILELPPVDTPANVVACTNYSLPALQHGNYYTKAGGKGNKLKAGDRITKSQTLYIFNKDATCDNQHSFKITVLPKFEDMSVCGSYTLPKLEVGGFYTAANGEGTHLASGTKITTTQRIYYFAGTPTANCADDYSFEVTVLPIPPVDTLEDVLLCKGEFYILPELTNGQYFSKAGRKGKQLSPGQRIEQTTTVYINNIELGCSNETSFKVEIRPLPKVENFTDVYTCDPYKLPVLRHGKYFTQPGGQGTELKGGEFISSTQTLYVYNTWDDLPICYSQNAFTVYVQGIEVGDFDDVAACDVYVLPELETGDYFTESRGQGKKLKAGDKITATQTLYVYGYKGTRFICDDEDSFKVSISKTPELPIFPAVESCGSYSFPEYSNPDYNIGYYRQPGGKDRITDKSITVPGTYVIYVYASAKGNASCVSESSFLVTVYPLPKLSIPGAILCRNPLTKGVDAKAQLNSGLDPSRFEVNWYLDGQLVHTGVDFAAEEAGEYTVRTVKLQPEVGADCNFAPTTVVVEQSGVPSIRAEVTEPFEDIAVVRALIEQGYGEYEYKLDNGSFQTNSEFYNVSSGVHTLTVQGVKGNCGAASLEVIVIKHPPFFSPDKDGSNETWGIPDLKDYPDAKIAIFDRYGKLLKLLRYNETWDGTFNGREMPMDDYWFRVTFEHNGQPKEYKGHFSLIR